MSFKPPEQGIRAAKLVMEVPGDIRALGVDVIGNQQARFRVASVVERMDDLADADDVLPYIVSALTSAGRFEQNVV
jgi:hypothetical protein